MPYTHDYAAVLLKKRIAMDRSFWPRLSRTLALRLNNAAWARSFNTHHVMDEVAYLEDPAKARPTSTKPAKKFSGPILGRFWHKHFTDARFLAQNVQNQWFGAYAEKHELLGAEIRKFFESFGEIAGAYLDEKDARAAAGRLAHEIVIGGMSRRTARKAMTGEWLIYFVHNGKNYYLDIATHDEQLNEAALYERLRDDCEWEFPFAFK
jgi:hypothetical protein